MATDQARTTPLLKLPLLTRAGQDGRTATVHAEIDASIDDVFSVLSDPETYAYWVVGAKEIRSFDSSWPATGATFHHTQGLPVVNLKDTTSVLDVEAGRYLELEVRARPLLVARTEFLLQRRSSRRTRVTMHETPIAGLLHAVDNPALTALVVLRNKEALRRLANVARERAGAASR